jgi:hypothetical protein
MCLIYFHFKSNLFYKKKKKKKEKKRKEKEGQMDPQNKKS